MADGPNLGQAYVQVMPSAEGISGKLEGILGEEGTSSGNMFGSMFAANLASKGVGLAAKAALEIGKAIVNTMNEAVDEYADYEQLTGGVEKLFGKSSDTVMRYAENAYKTAGISANSYMEQITSFSASLISSLDGDTQEAAKIGNRAIEDMSDNANTFGTDIQSIQNAYQGFAKQNYTMLDNLKLGYGGTKTEMQRLIQDAEKLDSSFEATRDANGDLTMSFADIVNAIHIVQDDMNITGTTAREAADTISGSAESSKAAWKNMMTTLADENGDTQEAVEEWVDAVATSTEKRMDAMATVLKNLPEAIGTFFMAAGSAFNDAIVSISSFGEALVDSRHLLEDHEELFKNYNTILEDGLTPLKEAESYWAAFKGLIDENGKIAEDHMGQADYLVQQINEQLGTQYSTQELINELISGESTTLDEILRKKEAEIQLEANKQLMKEAQAELDELHAQYDTNEAEIARLQDLIATTQEGTQSYYFLKKQIEDLQTSQDGLTQTIEADTAIMSQCWDNEAYAAEGSYEKMILLDQDLMKSADSVTQGKIDSLDQQLNYEQQHIADLEKMRTEANADEIDAEIAISNAKIANLQDSKEAELAVLAEENAKIEAEAAESNKVIEDDADEMYKNVTKSVEDLTADSKKAMDFSWNLPDLKLPHFSAEGGFSLNPLSIPKFGVSWYAKAMDEAQVLNGATIFGSADGKLLGGGEVGSEVISGEDHLIELINNSVAAVLGPMVPAMMQIAEMLGTYLPELSEATERPVYLDGDKLVGGIIGNIDSQLGTRQKLQLRGNA